MTTLAQDRNAGEILLYEQLDLRFLALLLVPPGIIIVAATEALIHSNERVLTTVAWIALSLVGFVVVCGIFPACTLWLMSQPSPMIRLTSDRFWYRGVGLAWREIADIEIVRYMLVPWVSIRLQSSEEFLNALPPYAAQSWATNLWWSKGRLIIPTVRGMSVEAQRDLFRNCWERNRRDHEQALLYSWDKWSSSSLAALLGVATFCIALAVKWPSLVLCLRLHIRTCALVDLVIAVGLASLTYLAILTVLKLVMRRHPNFDCLAALWRLNPSSWF